MKKFRKELRNIIVNGNLFYYIVNENENDIRFRAYSGQYKTSFFEVSFSWKDNWNINLYKPGTAAKLIEYALGYGWEHLKGKQAIKLSEGSFLIEKLKITE